MSSLKADVSLVVEPVAAPPSRARREWYAADGFLCAVQVFVFCCAHAAQIEAYLESSKWTSVPNFAVHTIVSTDCVSVGEVCPQNDAPS